MLRYGFVPEAQLDGRLAVVMADPTDVVKLDELELLLGQPVEVKVGVRSAIEEILQKSESAQRVLDEATEDFRIQLVQEDEEGEEVLSIDRITADTSPIIKLVDSTIFNAIQRRASDIHIETRDTEVVIKYRIDGVLYQAMEPIDKRHHQTIISRIKVMSELDIAEKRVPQDGRFKLRLQGPHDRLPRLDHALGARRGLRHPHPRQGVDEQGVQEPAPRHPGLRRGDACASCASSSASPTAWCWSPARPARARPPRSTPASPRSRPPRTRSSPSRTRSSTSCAGITQIPVNEKKGLTFARGLRSILRHDPDKVMVGEIRDEETAQIAIQSALTGHLVFTTVHANNVVDVLGRFLNMNVDLYNFVSALNCVLAQRLVRKICPHCKQPVQGHARSSSRRAASTRPSTPTSPSTRASGCIECNGTGFHGRLAVSELLDLSDHIRELILDRRPASEIKRAAKEEGMTFLRESALEKVLPGSDHAA